MSRNGPAGHSGSDGGDGQNGPGGFGGNRGEGSGADPVRQTRLAPPQYIDVDQTKFDHQPIPMGGQSGSYNTKSPNYADLMAKHQQGYKNPETGATEVPNMFNFNGTVYNFNPEDSSYKDTYGGNIITQDNGLTGRQGIEGIYGQYNPGAYQRDMGGIEAVAQQGTLQTLNPKYTKYQAEQAKIREQQQEAVKGSQVPTYAGGTNTDWHK
jgi:hypothetical protein